MSIYETSQFYQIVISKATLSTDGTLAMEAIIRISRKWRLAVCFKTLLFCLILVTLNVVCFFGPTQFACGQEFDFGSISRKDSQADLVFQCDFQQSSGPESKDVNYDDWPDLWERKKGRGYPAYSTIKIKKHSQSKNQRAFYVGLDGGKATVYSPKISVSQSYSYVLNGLAKAIRKEGHNCTVYATLNYFDKNGKLIKKDTIQPKSTGFESDWSTFSTKLLAIESEEIDHLTVGLHVEPVEETSLFGEAWFDEINLYQLPRIEMKTGHPLNVFTDPKEMELFCNVTGAKKNDAGILIQLYDEHGNLVRSTKEALQSYISTSGQRKKGKKNSKNILIWKLVENDAGTKEELLDKYCGFYRIVITLLDRDAEQLVRELSFVVIRPTEKPSQNLFGWSVPSSIKEIDADTVALTLKKLGVNWIKMPMWLDPAKQRQIEFHSTMIQKINRRGVEVVGVLDSPPKEVYKKYWQQEQGMAALTNDVDSFLAAVEPVLSQLRIRVSRWQIGADDDTSLAESGAGGSFQDFDQTGLSANQAKIKKITEFFLKYGEETKVGLPWIWLTERPTLGSSAWHFNSTIAYPELTANEIEPYVSSMPTTDRKEHWISVQPLDRDNYTLLNRARDLVDRFVEVKRLGLQRVFVPKPFMKRSGFFDQRGMPTEILVPWQILTSSLNGAEYLGRIQLPGGSVNQLFSKNGKAMMLIWNDQPTDEILYLGREIEANDLWGRRIEIAEKDGKSILKATPWPILVKNLDLQIAKIRQSVYFDKTTLASVTGRTQSMKFTFHNHFQRGVSGSVSLKNETVFNPEHNITFKVNQAHDFSHSIPVKMRRDSLTGHQLVQLDFKFHYQELVPFSAWYPFQVGLENVEFAMRTKMNKKGDYVCKISCINRSNRSISYAVYLYVPGRQRDYLMFLDVRPGQESKKFTIFDAKGLKGKSLWIRAQEARGQRTLNYRIPIE